MSKNTELKAGCIVVSTAGKDKDEYSVVVDIKDGFVYVADGKRRKLENPKRKNSKHLCATDAVLSLEQMATNPKIKKAIKLLILEERHVKG